MGTGRIVAEGSPSLKRTDHDRAVRQKEVGNRRRPPLRRPQRGVEIESSRTPRCSRSRPLGEGCDPRGQAHVEEVDISSTFLSGR